MRSFVTVAIILISTFCCGFSEAQEYVFGAIKVDLPRLPTTAPKATDDSGIHNGLGAIRGVGGGANVARDAESAQEEAYRDALQQLALQLSVFNQSVPANAYIYRVEITTSEPFQMLWNGTDNWYFDIYGFKIHYVVVNSNQLGKGR